MTDHYKKFDTAKRDPLDEQIDAALAKYAHVEPRVGLEERVLANLRSQPQPVRGIWWWRWAAVGAMAVLVLALLAWRLDIQTKGRVVRQPVTPDQKVQPQVAINTPSTPVQPTPVSLRHVKKQASRRVALAVSEPKLDQFPSPQPLTPEELALARYVKQFPEEATLIAKAQDELEKQLQQKMMEANSQSEPANSDREER